MTESIGRTNGVVLLLPTFKYCAILTTFLSAACGIIKDIAECTCLESKWFMKLNVDDKNNIS